MKAKGTTHFVWCLFSVISFLAGEEYRAHYNHGELLQFMHGTFLAEQIPHSFVINKKRCTFLYNAFPSGGEYRDRTGDLLHAMQALSQLS